MNSAFYVKSGKGYEIQRYTGIERVATVTTEPDAQRLIAALNGEGTTSIRKPQGRPEGTTSKRTAAPPAASTSGATPGKRGPGRPKMTEAEKAQRRAEREAKAASAVPTTAAAPTEAVPAGAIDIEKLKAQVGE